MVDLRNCSSLRSGNSGLVVGAAALVAGGCALDDDAGELQHVLELAGEGEAGVGPLALVRQVDVLVTLEQLDQLGVGFSQAGVVADDGGVLGHGRAELAPHLEGVFLARGGEELLIEADLAGQLGCVAAIAGLGL